MQRKFFDCDHRRLFDKHSAVCRQAGREFILDDMDDMDSEKKAKASFAMLSQAGILPASAGLCMQYDLLRPSHRKIRKRRDNPSDLLSALSRLTCGRVATSALTCIGRQEMGTLSRCAIQQSRYLVQRGVEHLDWVLSGCMDHQPLNFKSKVTQAGRRKFQLTNRQ